MAETLTTLLKTDTVRLFYDDVQDNNYYVFVSAISPSAADRTNVVNSVQSKNIFLDKVIFGKKILPTDTKFMIKYYPWQAGQVFAQYDDREDMEGQRFYCVVGPSINDTGDYRVYKCLYNNEGAKVAAAPNFVSTTTDQIYRTADSYVWKYMYKLTQAEFEAYNAVGYIPVVDDFEIAPFDVDATPTDANNYPISTEIGSHIDQIFVENSDSNSGYPRATGTLAARPLDDGEITIEGSLEYPLNKVAGYYSGMSVAITLSDGNTNLYKCSTYSYQANTDLGTIGLSTGDDPLADGVGRGAQVEILPKITIEGDGSGASAKPVITNGQITSIVVLNKGSGYNTVTAKVEDPVVDFNPGKLSTDNRAVIRPIMSPKGGHNTDRLEELSCRHVLLYGYITEADNNQIGATNLYSHLGIVKSPAWESANTDLHNPTVFDNRIKIVTDDYASLVVNEVVTQVDDDNITCFSAKVHQIDQNANTVWLYDYNQVHAPRPGNDIALDYGNDFQNESGVTISINTPVADNVTESPLTQRSGLVYFMEDFSPLERNQTSREEYKLLLEF